MDLWIYGGEENVQHALWHGKPLKGLFSLGRMFLKTLPLHLSIRINNNQNDRRHLTAAMAWGLLIKTTGPRITSASHKQCSGTLCLASWDIYSTDKEVSNHI